MSETICRLATRPHLWTALINATPDILDQLDASSVVEDGAVANQSDV